MDWEKLNRPIVTMTIVLVTMEISLIAIAITNKSYYYQLKNPIYYLSVFALAMCFSGYVINQKYLSSKN